jgi:hypothetical protein
MSKKRTLEDLFDDIEELEGDYFLSDDLKAIRHFKAWLRLCLGPRELADEEYEDELRMD